MNQILKESLPNVWTWSFFSEEKKINFNGLLIFNDRLWVLIDPPPASPEILNEIGQKKIDAIFLTNADHERMSPDFKRMTGAPLWIHEKDAPSLEEVKADRLFRDGDLLPGGFRVIHLQDQKTPGESAFCLEERRILILGDALIGPQPGKLRLLPAEKYADISKVRKGLAPLLNLDFDAVFIGDGYSIPTGGRALVEALFRNLEEVRT